MHVDIHIRLTFVPDWDVPSGTTVTAVSPGKHCAEDPGYQKADL